MSSDLQLSDLNAIQALTALNWWTCYANTTGNNIAWIPTVQARIFNEMKNLPAQNSSVRARLINSEYYIKLMKLIPYGVADGSLSSSSPHIYELEVYLMRALGIEEGQIQNQLLSQGIQNPSRYMMNSVVKQKGKEFADQVIAVANSQGVQAAQALIDQKKSGANNHSSGPAKTFSGLRGPEVNGKKPSVHPFAMIAIPLFIMYFAKQNNSDSKNLI